MQWLQDIIIIMQFNIDLLKQLISELEPLSLKKIADQLNPCNLIRERLEKEINEEEFT